jgi:hypothetical protein
MDGPQVVNFQNCFRGNFFLNIFPIGSYVKTMSADGSHLEWRSGSQDIILKIEKKFPLKPVGQFKANMA